MWLPIRFSYFISWWRRTIPCKISFTSVSITWEASTIYAMDFFLWKGFLNLNDEIYFDDSLIKKLYMLSGRYTPSILSINASSNAIYFAVHLIFVKSSGIKFSKFTIISQHFFAKENWFIFSLGSRFTNKNWKRYVDVCDFGL